MPSEDSLPLLFAVASPQRKRARVDAETPQCVRALQDAEMWLAFDEVVLSAVAYRLLISYGLERRLTEPPVLLACGMLAL